MREKLIAAFVVIPFGVLMLMAPGVAMNHGYPRLAWTLMYVLIFLMYIIPGFLFFLDLAKLALMALLLLAGFLFPSAFVRVPSDSLPPERLP